MKPYYEHGGITIYHGDCREVLPYVTGGVAVTDPPYNVGLKYGDATNDSRDDYRLWCAEWFAPLRNSVNGPIAISCGVANVGMWWTIEPPTWVLAWVKPAAMGRCVFGFNNWEPIVLYGKPVKQGVDVIKATIVTNEPPPGHPCPKPLEWAAKQIAVLSIGLTTVVDPFIGTGTTMRAAKDMGHRAIGIEIEERYCEIAARRLEQEVLPLEA